MSTTDQVQHYLSLFEDRASGEEAETLAALRRDAMTRFREIGFPTRKTEAWRYTNMSRLLGRDFQIGTPSADVTTDDIAPHHLPGIATSLVFVDGLFRADLSRLDAVPAGLSVASLAQRARQDEGGVRGDLVHWRGLERDLFEGDHAFAELNLAFFGDGSHVRVDEGVELDEPIGLIFYSSDGSARATHVRNIVSVGSGSRASLVEVHAGREAGMGLSNVTTDLVVAPNARFDHFKLLEEPAGSSHVAAVRIAQGADSEVSTSLVAFGGGQVRHEVEARILGTGCDCNLLGLYVVDGDRQIDNYTTIHHAEPHCHSREIYKGILLDRAQGAFTGRIFVHQDAQKTDAEQSNDALLLSRKADISSRPNLEIYADDVRCTHGATVGELSEDELFYIRSRGIDLAEAKHMLTRAFAHRAIDEMPLESVRERADELLRRALKSNREGS